MKNVLVLGAGQLARMMALAVTPLNINVLAYDVRSDNIVEPISQRKLTMDFSAAIDAADVITAEFEHIPEPVLQQSAASGKLQPSADAIRIGGDRCKEKQWLSKVGAPNAPFMIFDRAEKLHDAVENLGYPLVIKSALGGYDGKGQWRLKHADQLSELLNELSVFLNDHPEQQLIAEKFIHFDREVSLLGARNQQGQTVFYPLQENHHVDGVLSLSRVVTINPTLQQQAQAIFNKIAEPLDYQGVLAIEFFQQGDTLLVNEIAPRVHNSGHWSQQGADTCQFENHIRAVTNLPLGHTQLVRPTVMLNILGLDTLPDDLLALPGVHLHWYGKEKRAGRKMGHINICADSQVALDQKLAQLRQLLPPEDFPALHH